MPHKKQRPSFFGGGVYIYIHTHKYIHTHYGVYFSVCTSPDINGEEEFMTFSGAHPQGLFKVGRGLSYLSQLWGQNAPAAEANGYCSIYTHPLELPAIPGDHCVTSSR